MSSLRRMKIEVREYAAADRGAVIALSLRAWAPVHASLGEVLGEELQRAMTPDPMAAQRGDVEAALDDPALRVHVAEVDGAVAGFSAVRAEAGAELGEVHMVAVDPDHQGRGIGRLLTSHAVDTIAAAGIPVAMVETGGDPGHAAARRTYAAAGFTPLPIVRYFRLTGSG